MVARNTQSYIIWVIYASNFSYLDDDTILGSLLDIWCRLCPEETPEGNITDKMNHKFFRRKAIMRFFCDSEFMTLTVARRSSVTSLRSVWTRPVRLVSSTRARQLLLQQGTSQRWTRTRVSRKRCSWRRCMGRRTPSNVPLTLGFVFPHSARTRADDRGRRRRPVRRLRTRITRRRITTRFVRTGRAARGWVRSFRRVGSVSWANPRPKALLHIFRAHRRYRRLARRPRHRRRAWVASLRRWRVAGARNSTNSRRERGRSLRSRSKTTSLTARARRVRCQPQWHWRFRWHH